MTQNHATGRLLLRSIALDESENPNCYSQFILDSQLDAKIQRQHLLCSWTKVMINSSDGNTLLEKWKNLTVKDVSRIALLSHHVMA